MNREDYLVRRNAQRKIRNVQRRIRTARKNLIKAIELLAIIDNKESGIGDKGMVIGARGYRDRDVALDTDFAYEILKKEINRLEGVIIENELIIETS